MFPSWALIISLFSLAAVTMWQMIFCFKKNPLLYDVFGYLIAPDRDGVYIVADMFDIYDSWSGCFWRDTRDSQGEWASGMLHASLAETATNMPWTWSIEKEDIYIYIYILLFVVKQHTWQESLMAMSIVLYLFCFSSHVWFRESLWDLGPVSIRRFNSEMSFLFQNSQIELVQLTLS